MHLKHNKTVILGFSSVVCWKSVFCSFTPLPTRSVHFMQCSETQWKKTYRGNSIFPTSFNSGLVWLWSVLLWVSIRVCVCIYTYVSMYIYSLYRVLLALDSHRILLLQVLSLPNTPLKWHPTCIMKEIKHMINDFVFSHGWGMAGWQPLCCSCCWLCLIAFWQWTIKIAGSCLWAALFR